MLVSTLFNYVRTKICFTNSKAKVHHFSIPPTFLQKYLPSVLHHTKTGLIFSKTNPVFATWYPRNVNSRNLFSCEIYQILIKRESKIQSQIILLIIKLLFITCAMEDFVFCRYLFDELMKVSQQYLRLYHSTTQTCNR